MSRNSVQVCIKVRPLLMPKERDAICLWQVKGNSIHLLDSQADPFFFDFIFDQHVNNEEIFEKMAKNIVHACVKGFNGTIFAYGQTSSGKTYTMMGDESNPGVMVLAAKEIFKQIEANPDRQFLIRVGYFEIYNEKIYDLLEKKNQDLKIHETATGMVNVDCVERYIRSEEELLDCLCSGNKERTVGETNMNERSSRSHAIFRIIIESRKTDRSEDDAVSQSILNLVDLAGSERANQTGASGARLKEGGHINKSLLFLSNVIKHLSENRDLKFISYRDSKLTRILQASLGGNALTSIICTIKPTIVEETQSTLNFAMRAKVIKNKPHVNETVSDATMMRRLEHEIKDLKNRLDEERRKNESQIKVGLLEQRIKNDMLKIISSNSLHNLRNIRDKRRRTWCPASSLAEISEQPPSQLPVPVASGGNKISGSSLPKPSFYPSKVTTRDAAPKTVSIFKSLDLSIQGDDDFKPAELFDFNGSPAKFHTPRKNSDIFLTPTLKEIPGKTLEIVEQELTELQRFTSLENKFEVQHELYQTLKHKLNIISDERDRLQKERLIYIQNKEEFDEIKQSLRDSEKRCEDLQIQISKLTNSNQCANETIRKYETQLADLKATIEKLEMENREVVSLEVEFDRHKSKAQQRETELLSVLSEKDSEITKLQKKLDAATEDALRNSKDKQLKNGNVKSECETTDSICVKCEDLQRLLEENKQVSADFAKLTLEYEKLQESYQQMSCDAARTQSRLEELEQTQCAESAESEQLRIEIASIRAKLLEVQSAYEELSCDRNAKTEACDTLNRIVASAQNDMQLLQTKYDTLELAWQEQQLAVKSIQAEYDAIQLKYESLQAEYKQLEQSSASSQVDCERLLNENKNLQAEIGLLKARVEDAQRMLLESPKEKLADVNAELNELRQKNAKLSAELNEIQSQFDSLQQEYDDLSNQLLENIQESDVLREKCAKLEEEKSALISLQTPASTLSSKTMANVYDTHYSDVDSMKSSGVCTDSSDSSETDNEMLNKFLRFAETLHEIELEHENGRARVFRAKEINEKTPAYKLCIRNIQDVIAQENDDCSQHYDGRVCLQGVLKKSSFHIIEVTENLLSDDTPKEDANVELKIYISELEKEIEDRNLLLEVTERTIKEMRDQVANLESALLEKSIIVEKVEDFQRQIVSLEKEKAEISMVCEELQEKVKEITMSESFMSTQTNETLSCSQIETTELAAIKAQRLELETKVNTLQAELDRKMQTLQEKDELIQQLQDKIGAMTADKIEIEKRTSKLQAQLEQIEKQTADDAELIANLEFNKAALDERIANADAVMNEFEQRMNELQIQLTAKTLELESNVVLIKRLECEIKENNAMNDAKLRAEVAELKELCDKTETAMAEMKASYEQQLDDIRAELVATKSSMQTNEKQYKDEINRINLEFYEKLEFSESVFRTNMQKYNREWEDGKDLYETKLAELEVKLAESAKLKEKQDADNQMKVERIQKEHTEALAQLQVEKHELENTIECNKKLITKLQCELTDAEKSTSEQLDLMAAAEEMKAKCTSLERANAELELELKKNAEIAKQEISQLYENYEKKLSENASLKSDYDSLLNEIKNDKSELKIELEQSKLQMQQMEQKLSLQNDLETKNVQLTASVEELSVKCAKQAATLTDYDRLKSQYENLVADTKQHREKLEQELSEYKSAKAKAEDNAETLQTKLDSLEQELHSVKLKSTKYDKLLLEQAIQKKMIIEANASKIQLEEQLLQLNEKLKLAEEQDKCIKSEIERLSNELISMRHEKNKADEALQQKLTEEQLALQRDCNELKTALDEMQLKYDALQKENNQLSAKNTQLQIDLTVATEKAQQCETLRLELEDLKSKLSCSEVQSVELKQLKVDYNVLEKRLEDTVLEAGKTSKTLQAQINATKVLLEESVAKHKKMLETKQTEFNANKEQLEGTISCLLADKKSMEDRLDLTEVLMKRLEAELSLVVRKSDNTSINTSYESNNSITSPVGRKSLDPKIIVPEERRNRRVSLYDERRPLTKCDDRQLASGVEKRDVGSITDPVDSNCKCTELSTKLKEHERNLYIRDAQVKSLLMELKNHPLIDENAMLKKRLQEDQERYRHETKRLKQKNLDLISKIGAANQSPTTTKTSADTSTATSKVPTIKVLSNVETQTESDLETCLHKLQVKLTETEKICRSRYKLIKELEQKISEIQNSDDYKILSLEVGQISVLKSQNDALKSELVSTKEKFENAVIVLKLKRREIEQLKSQLTSRNSELPR